MEDNEMKKIFRSAVSLAMATAMTVSVIPEKTWESQGIEALAKSSGKSELSKKLLEGKSALPDKNGKKEEANYKEGQAIVMYRTKQSTIKKSSVGNKAMFGSDITVEDSCEFTLDSKKGSMSTKSLGTKTAYTVSLVRSANLSTKELIASLQNTEGVLYAQPNYIRKIDNAESNYEKYLWGLNNKGQFGGTENTDVGIDSIDKSQYSKDEKVIALVDTGIDYTHKDLEQVVWQNPYEEELKGAHGYDFMNGDTDPMDDNGHGSHCSGIMAANGQDNSGVTGIADGTNVKIMALKVFDAEGMGDTYAAISAYNYIYKAQQLGTNVVAVNNSWGGVLDYEYGDDVFEEVINLVGEKGAVSVCAASNEGTDNDEYQDISPACLDSDYIISVAAANEDGELASFSNYGAKSVDIAAPGSDILSTVSYDNFNPSIYENTDELCDYYQDFSQELQLVDMEELADAEITATGGAVYAVETEGDGKVSITRSDKVYMESANGDKNSLMWKIENAKMNDEYKLYIAYDKNASTTPVYQNFMYRVEQPKFSWDRFYTEEDYWPTFVNVADTKVTTGSALDSNVIGTTYVLDPMNYWSQCNYEEMSKLKEKDAGRYVFEIELLIGMDGDYTFYLDDFANSKAEVDSEQFGKYAYYNGTSMAAPYVTGGVAVAKALYPKDTAIESRERVVTSAKETEALKGKVASNGMLCVENFAKPKPSITNAVMDKGTVTLDGAFFGENPSVTVNGQSVTLTSSSNNKVSFAAKENQKLEITLTNKQGTTTTSCFFTGGEQSKATAVTDNLSGVGEVVSDGDQIYMVDDAGYAVAYPVQDEMYYYSGELYGENKDALPYLEMCSVAESFDKEHIFGKDYKTVVDYDLSKMTDTVSCGKQLYTIVAMDMGYAKELALVKLDEEKGEWDFVANVPKAYKNIEGATFAAYGNALYLIGGYHVENQKTVSTVYRFDLSNNQWSEVAALPEGKFFSKAVWTNGKLAVILGGTGDEKTVGSGKTFFFDGTNWTEGATLTGVLEENETSVEVPYSKELTESEDLVVDHSFSTAERTLRYFDAAVGATDEGMIMTGLKVEGVGNTFSYNISSNSYQSLGIKFSTLAKDDNVVGATVGNKFYIFSGQQKSFVEEEYYYEYYSNSGIRAKEQEVTTQKTGYEEIGTDYVTLITAVDVKHTTCQVVQAQPFDGGYVTGLGSYNNGEYAHLKIYANEDFFLKGWAVDGVPQTATSAAVLVNNPTTTVSADFGKYVTMVMLGEEMVEAGSQVAMTSYIYPEDADNQTLTWVSSDETIATVDEKGIVTAKADAAGKTVEIKAIAADRGKIYGVGTVIVMEKTTTKTVAVKKIKLTASKKTIKVGKSIKIKATVKPVTATNKKLKWKSSNKKYATVTQKGKVTAKKKGKGHTVKITATSKSNPKIKGTIKIKIK